MRASILVVALAAAALALPDGAVARDWPSWLVPCGAQRRCGTFTVPLDRARPEHGTIGLAVEVILAERPTGTTAFVPITGGPGGASTELGDWAQLVFSDVGRREDILLVDQRGTGRSGPLFCPFPGLLTPRSTPEQVLAYWRACLGDLGADPADYTSADAVDDLDAVRAALGYDRLDLYGVSYGATAAQYALLLHGGTIRSAILDGGTSLDVPIFERWAPNGQSALDRLFARCARRPACHRAFPRPAADLRALLARLARKPALIEGGVVDRDAAAQAIQVLSRRPETAARIPLVLRRVNARGVRAVLPLLGDVSPGGGVATQLMYWAIVCLEPWARQDPAEVARLARGTYLEPTAIRSARFSSAVCAAMPHPPDVPGADALVRSDVPTLIVVGGDDPQDPRVNVAGLLTTMPNARLVVVRYAGHGSVGIGCTGGIASAFVVAGSASGLDVGCASRTPQPMFVLP